MSDQHARFLERLRRSSRAVFAVAWYMHNTGRRIEIPAVQFAPDASQHPDYVDIGDLYVWLGDKRERLEVKGRAFNFTSAKDFPYPSMMIGNVPALDRAGVEVLYYIGVSKDLRYAAIAHQKTRPQWEVITGEVKNTGNVESNYACPIELLKFQALRE